MTLIKTCCLFIPLRLGCFIIGYIQMAYRLVQIILSIIVLAGGLKLSRFDIEYNEIAQVLVISSSVTLVFQLLFLGFTVLFLIGLIQERRGYVKAFLIYALFFLIIYMVLFFVSLGFGFISFWNIFFGLLEIIVGAYFLFVVYNHYKAMGNNGINGA